MTESTPHAEDPAEGADTDTTADAGRTPHAEQPAEGADPTAGTTDDEADAASGVDPANRISEA
ncbi:hypothetical protein SAMN05660199_04391 [Klenkia soli]|uniref:Uncharacterized protein n=1 Tax=Klenkia soli TaxID=1052260 RepID=A0A1H0U5Q8_9ACTN|nr:hypothetical protein [Klenkia soli]SDP61617.1 hypothetical protein SAMN05660199_04391 [Klenkia soli]